MSGVGKVVCVRGGSGYIASWLVKLLLQREYTVKASKTGHLLALDGAKERLHLFEASLLEEGSFDSAINGCDGVFHTASPAILSATDPQAEIIDPAVKGTLSVLRSCAKVPSIKRVVITSSIARVIYNGKTLTPDVEVDETWISDPVICENLKHHYAVSKTLAENVAWKFANENGIDLVTVHPGVVIGPLLQPTVNGSVKLIPTQINGPQTFPNRVYTFVDVRDVANVHIQAFEVASASGRYCLAGNVAHISEIIKILRELYLTLSFPEKSFIILDQEKNLTKNGIHCLAAVKMTSLSRQSIEYQTRKQKVSESASSLWK
ncbi:NAD(P)-binding domain containing protein [Parasponia andersonii]|uniref:NAD(P)-binding domain containing protein n=1 Tax=Parasponia andersonii TaxID=3476 RepID=A0A2P5DLY4_PARAD|nr:NAD(P)-binding domain containing protein [Parasponia andersonii]